MKFKFILFTYKNYFFIGLASLIFFLLYSQNINDAYRGEMWELLYIWSSDISIIDKFKKVLNFACFGAGRFQPLAFFIPYFQVVIGGISFVTSHMFTLLLHLSAALMVYYLSNIWTKDNFASCISFALVLFSFIISDVLIWTFFSYIQVHSILLLFSIYFFTIFLRNNKIYILLCSSILGILSTFMYESGIVTILIQPFLIFIIPRGRSIKEKFIEISIPGILIIFYFYFGYLMMSLDYRDSNTHFHYMIPLKLVNYFLYYFRYNFGINSVPDIFNIATLYGLYFEINFYNIIILCLFSYLSVLFIFKVINNFFIKKNKFSVEVLTVFFNLIGYLLIMSYGRVQPNSGFFEPTGLETQFRYYYVPNLLIILLLGTLWAKIGYDILCKAIIILFTLFATLGNIKNILKFGSELSAATLPTTLAASEILTSEMSYKIDDKLFIKKMHYRWYSEDIDTPRIYRAFTYNANTCLPHFDITRKTINNDYFLSVTSSNIPIRQDLKTPVNLIKMSKYKVSSNSQFPGAGPMDAMDEAGGRIWHVKHIPSPPQVTWAEIDFSENDKKNITAIAFKPRSGKVEQFWDNMKIEASNDREIWSEIADIKLGKQPDDDDWIYTQFENNNFYQYYRLTILGGFSLGRFISLQGIKIYEKQVN